MSSDPSQLIKQVDAKLEELTELRRQLLAIINTYPGMQNCWSCDYFDNGYCRLWQAEPPDEFKAKGCEHWEGVPF